jgi:hypothetical protein
MAAALLVLLPGAGAEVSQKGTLRVLFAGKIHPRKLPRHTPAPIAMSLSGQVRTTDRSDPPQLRRIVLAINRHGQFDTRGLPVCDLDRIQPATSDVALQSCRGALVGEGRLLADVALPDQSPFPSNGRLLAFNGRQHGKPVIYAHIYGTEPLPASYTIVFTMSRHAKSRYGATLTAHLPRIAADWGFVNGINITLGRKFEYRRHQRSYLSAACPAVDGTIDAVFPLVRTTFGFDGGVAVTSTLTRSCKVRG